MPSTTTDRPSITINPVTVDALSGAIIEAFQSIDYVVIDDFMSGTTRNVVFKKTIVSLAKTFNTVFFQIQISFSTTIRLTQILHTGWNEVAHTGSNTGPGVGQTQFSVVNPINLRLIRSQAEEFDLLCVWQVNTSFIGGWVHPATLNQVDENFFNCFLAIDFASKRFYGVGAAVSLNSANILSWVDPMIAGVNHYNKADICPKLQIVKPNPSGFVVGLTSDDLALGAGAGTSIGARVGDWQKICDGATSNASLYVK